MTQQKSMSTRAWVELLLLSMIWGGSFLAVRVALDEISFLQSVAHRVLWAALLMWAVVLIQGHKIPRSPRIWGAFLIMGLLNNVLPFSLMAWGQLYIESGLTAIFNASTAFFGAIVAAMAFADERLSANKIIGVLFGMAGIVIIIGPDALRNFDLRSMAQLAILAGALSYALASVWGRKTLGGMPPELAAAGMLTGACVIILPTAWMLEGPLPLTLAPDTMLAIGYYALIASALAYLLYYRILAVAGSGNLMLCTLLIVPFAVVLGAMVRNETLPPAAYAGFACLAIGLVIIDGRAWRALIDRRARRG